MEDPDRQLAVATSNSTTTTSVATTTTTTTDTGAATTRTTTTNDAGTPHMAANQALGRTEASPRPEEQTDPPIHRPHPNLLLHRNRPRPHNRTKLLLPLSLNANDKTPTGCPSRAAKARDFRRSRSTAWVLGKLEKKKTPTWRNIPKRIPEAAFWSRVQIPSLFTFFFVLFFLVCYIK